MGKMAKEFRSYPELTGTFYQNVYLDSDKNYLGYTRFRTREETDEKAIPNVKRIYCIKIICK